jgi:hypothetical protein
LRQSAHAESKVVEVRAVNDGHRPLEVATVSFRLDNDYDVHVMPAAEVGHPDDLPKLLTDGQSATQLYDLGPFGEMEKEGRRIVSAVVTDAAGNEYTTAYPS